MVLKPCACKTALKFMFFKDLPKVVGSSLAVR